MRQGALVRSELLKLRTTHVWWIFGIAMFALTAVSLAFTVIEASFRLQQASAPPPPGAPPGLGGEDLQVAVAADIYTAGQFFGLMFALLLGALLMTNEYQHQTASATFLATPKRTPVVLAKLITAALIGAGLWAVATALDIVVGASWLASNVGPHLGRGEVAAAIGLNLLAYAIWGMLGVGLGALIRSQIGAVIVALALYVLTGAVARGMIMVLATYFDAPWLDQFAVLLPYTASQLLVEGIDLPNSPPRALGAAILISYGLLAGVVGAALTRRRDIT
ncbi:MAG: ABC transporter permease subunit [Micromonosporaceae bacterium]